MSRSRSVTLAVAVAFLAPAAGAFAGESAPPPPGPILPLGEYTRLLTGPDREKRLLAVEAIRDHYKGQVIDALPQIIEALGDELDRAPGERGVGGVVRLQQTLWQTADQAGPGRVKVARESTRHESPRIRAAGFLVWGVAARDKNAGVDRGELLAAVRRGLKDDSPLVRRLAVGRLLVFHDAPEKVTDEVLSLLVTALDDRARPHEGAESPASTAARIIGAFGAKAKTAIPALAKAAGTGEPRLVGGACNGLEAIARADEKAAEEVVKVVRPLLVDKSRSEMVRGSAAYVLRGVGPAVRWAVPDLADILEEPGASSEFRRHVLRVLGISGPRAAAAVPAIIKRLETTNDEQELWEIFLALKTIGPAASPAVGPLEKWIERSEYPFLRVRAHAALKAIVVDPKF